MAVRGKKSIADSKYRINRIMSYQEKKIRKVFLAAIAQIKSAKTLEEIATLLETGNFYAALQSVSSAAEHIGNSYGSALSDAAQKTAEWLSTTALTVNVSFDQTNSRAVKLMQENKLRLIREFTAEQQEATRIALTQGIAEGLNPIAQARAFRDSIGLTAKQQEMILRYKQILQGIGQSKGAATNALSRALRDGRYDRSILAAVKTGTPLSAEMIDRMTTRYQEKWLAYRADTIARTEAMSAVNQGNAEMYAQAIASGALEQSEVERTWSASLDGRTRDSHVMLNGQSCAVGEVWHGLDGDLRYPGDPDSPASERCNCRCSITTVLNPQSL